MDIFKVAEQNQPDYYKIRKVAVKSAIKSPAEIVVIIPVRGRLDFHLIVADHFRNAAKNVPDKRIVLVFTEHSSHPEHINFHKQYNEEYIWIPAIDDPFNKCLAHNTAALFFPSASYYLFHDIDIMVPENFFILLFENLKDNDALQCFTGRRLMQCSQIVTKEIFAGQNNIHNLRANQGGVQLAEIGASGGSILVKNHLFYDVGGFDPEFFSEYSVEDQFFFDKLNLMGKFGFCDNPPIELFHLWHPPAFNRITKPQDWDAIESFKDCTLQEQLNFIRFKGGLFKKYLL